MQEPMTDNVALIGAMLKPTRSPSSVNGRGRTQGPLEVRFPCARPTLTSLSVAGPRDSKRARFSRSELMIGRIYCDALTI